MDYGRNLHLSRADHRVLDGAISAFFSGKKIIETPGLLLISNAKIDDRLLKIRDFVLSTYQDLRVISSYAELDYGNLKSR